MTSEEIDSLISLAALMSGAVIGLVVPFPSWRFLECCIVLVAVFTILSDFNRSAQKT
jgi:hypothetical protein